MAGAVDGLHQLFIVGFGQAPQVADGVEAYVVLVQGSSLSLDGLGQQRHQPRDFGEWSVPVLGGESIQSQVRHTEFGAGFGDLAHRLDGALMAEDTLLAAFLGPTSVAVHNDGNVLRQARHVDLLLQLFLEFHVQNLLRLQPLPSGRLIFQVNDTRAMPNQSLKAELPRCCPAI